MDEEKVEESTSEDSTEEESSEEKTPNKEWETLYENQKTRAEKAEARLKKVQKELDSKEKETVEDTPKTKPEDDGLLKKYERLALKAAGIAHEDDVELVQKTAKKWNMDIDEVVEDEDFKAKLERQQEARANKEATSNVKGDEGKSSAKDSADYWKSKGQPPTSDDVPDKKKRRKIIREFMKSGQTGGKTFYND